MAQFQIPVTHVSVQTGIVFDQASASPYEAALSTYSWSHTVGAGGTNRLLLVAVSIFATGTVTGITYDGVAMSFVRADANSIYRTEIWQLVAPATGTKTIAVTLSLSATSIATAASYTGVDQAVPVEANAGANGVSNPASASVTTGFVRDRVFGAISTKTGSGVVVASGEAPRANNTGALGTGASADLGAVDVASSKTLTWNGITALDNWAVSLAALKPVQPVTAITGAITFSGFAAGQAKASGALVGKCFCSAFSVGQLKGAAQARGTGCAASQSAGQAKAAGKLQGKPVIAMFTAGSAQATARLQGAATAAASADGQVKAAARLQGAPFIATSTAGAGKGTAALSGKLFTAAFSTTAGQAAGKLQSKAFAAAFADGQATATATLRGTGAAAMFTVGAGKSSAALSGECSVTVLAAGAVTGAGRLRGQTAIAVFAAGQSTATLTLQGAIIVATFATDKLVSTGHLSGVNAISFTTSGVAHGVAVSRGRMTVSTFTVGAMSGEIVLSGKVFSASVASAQPTVSGRLQGSSNVTWSFAGDIVAKAQAQGIAFSSVFVVGQRTAQSPGPLVGTAFITTSTRGLLSLTSSPPPPEFEEQLGILVRHRCGTPVFAGESDSVCGVPVFAVNSETRRASGDIGVMTSQRCSAPTLNVTTAKITQRSTRWPASITRR